MRVAPVSCTRRVEEVPIFAVMNPSVIIPEVEYPGMKSTYCIRTSKLALGLTTVSAVGWKETSVTDLWRFDKPSLQLKSGADVDGLCTARGRCVGATGTG